MNRFHTQLVATDREDATSVALSLRGQWLRDILIQTGMNLEGCFPDNNEEELSIENKAKLRSTLNKNDIFLRDDGDGTLQLYLEKTVIAEWKRPKFELHQDLSQIDPKKQLYTVIKLEYWSVFDEVAEESNG